MPHAHAPKPRKDRRLQAYLLQNEHRFKPRKFKDYIDLDIIRGLCAIGCTIQEIASTLGVSSQWVADERNANPTFALAMDQGYTDMKQSLRRAQLTMALNGSTAMLIWLGKQHLGQADKHEQNNKTEISITVQKAMDELRNIPRDQLLAAQALLTAPVIDHEESQPEPESRGEGTPAIEVGVPG